MAKRWKKQKAGQQHTKKRKAHAGDGGGSASAAGGAIGGLRRFTKGLVGSRGSDKPKTPIGKVFDLLTWVAIAVVGYIMISRQCTH